MNGQKKQFIGICVLVVLCVAAYFGLKTYNAKTTEKEQKEEESKKIEAVKIDKEKVNAFSYQLNGTTITFEKDGDTWYYQPDHSINIDQDKINTMLAAVADVTSEEKLENVEDTSEYGFDNPTNVLTFTMGDGTRTITIGMQNEITNQYYIMDNNSDTIYIVDSSMSTAFSKSVEDMTATADTSSDTSGDASTDTTGE
ncbi:DUF4340 domain-containing protein [Roseburia sp. MSJ-14]|uniref:DUF4340 domain-containing protein n=1 Tax=Roseburia sp. MSJ-14 TaxID=2841514 RepID=UPI001C117428|nr:DUF4340 domain-containing protein [Roseburia sp. MSJ-14]MBU5472340.1 DUF4340 domain-containing protein [Roseburia sp. MSJ-14]